MLDMILSPEKIFNMNNDAKNNASGIAQIPPVNSSFLKSPFPKIDFITNENVLIVSIISTGKKAILIKTENGAYSLMLLSKRYDIMK